jgi:hypothetical protein
MLFLTTQKVQTKVWTFFVEIDEVHPELSGRVIRTKKKLLNRAFLCLYVKFICFLSTHLFISNNANGITPDSNTFHGIF